MTQLGIIISRICNKQGMWSNLNLVTEERVWYVEERKREKVKYVK